MSFIWKSPFNRVVRSNEALVGGILMGIILGVLMMLFVPIIIKDDQYMSPTTLCGEAVNVKTVTYSYIGRVQKVVCKDKRSFDKF